MPPARVRRARPSDLPALRALERAAFQPWRRASPRSLRRSLAQNAKGRSGRQSVWVVDHPSRPGALAALLVLWHHRTLVRVYDVATDPGERGQGHGHALMRHAEALARRQGCAAVSLEADARDRRLLAWYRRQGYAPVQRLPGYYPGGRPAVRLRKAV